jgi:putative transposase
LFLGYCWLVFAFSREIPIFVVKLRKQMHKNRKGNRLKGYDYSRDNLYFVTPCVQNRWCCLGNILNGVMHKNQYGEIVEKQWFWLMEQYPYVVSHAFIVMPNHAHGVLEIDRNRVRTGRDLSMDMDNEDVGTGRDLSLRLRYPSIPPPMKIKSLSELMGAFKTTSSKHIHLAGLQGFSWQRSFHDHIIRDDFAYEKICNYIDTNPLRWNEDMFYNDDFPTVT